MRASALWNAPTRIDPASPCARSSRSCLATAIRAVSSSTWRAQDGARLCERGLGAPRGAVEQTLPDDLLQGRDLLG